MLKRDVVLALDIGTSSARILLYTPDAQPVSGAQFQREYKPSIDESGRAEFPVSAWQQHIETVVDEACAFCENSGLRPVAVGCTTFWHSMLGVDAAGAPLTPLYTWADTRPDHTLASLLSRLDARTLHAETGCALHSSYYPARLWWLARTDPSLHRQVKRWLSPAEFLYLRWLGTPACSISMASATGIFDQHRTRWSQTLLQALELHPEQLGDLCDLDCSAGTLLPHYAERWPILAKVPWAPAIGDGAAGNLGSGCIGRDRIAVNIGTSAAIRLCFESEEVSIPDDLWCYRLDARRRLLGAAFSDGGDAVDWLYNTLRLPERSAADTVLQNRPRAEHGISLLPFLLGERSMGWRPDATAVLHGLRRASDPLDILQAAMEGISNRLSEAYAHLIPYAEADHTITAGGGALMRWKSWRQMLADAMDHPIRISSNAETTSRGAALCALRILGEDAPFSKPPAAAGEDVPTCRDGARRMRAARIRQNLLYDAIVKFDTETAQSAKA